MYCHIGTSAIVYSPHVENGVLCRKGHVLYRFSDWTHINNRTYSQKPWPLKMSLWCTIT